MVDQSSKPPITVLLVEDDPGDVLIITEALSQAAPAHDLHTVPDGEAALQYLRRQGPYRDAPRPDLVLLDLNLPRVNGRQVLAAVKEDRALRCIPVVVLSTSEAADDVLHSYDLYANAYVAKPVDFEAFVQVIRQIDDFFLHVVLLPPRPA
jgi:CheY-like chemotaxis protein